MSLTGSFKTMPASDLLQWLSMSRKSGSLLVTTTSQEIRFFFDYGRVICSSSSDPSWLLGALLVREGFITPAQQEDALERQKKNMRSMGKILLEVGAITEVQLLSVVQLNVEHQIQETLLSQDSNFVFIENDQMANEVVPLGAEVVPILLQSLRYYDEDENGPEQELLF